MCPQTVCPNIKVNLLLLTYTLSYAQRDCLQMHATLNCLQTCQKTFLAKVGFWIFANYLARLVALLPGNRKSLKQSCQRPGL